MALQVQEPPPTARRKGPFWILEFATFTDVCWSRFRPESKVKCRKIPGTNSWTGKSGPWIFLLLSVRRDQRCNFKRQVELAWKLRNALHLFCIIRSLLICCNQLSSVSMPLSECYVVISNLSVRSDFQWGLFDKLNKFRAWKLISLDSFLIKLNL